MTILTITKGNHTATFWAWQALDDKGDELGFHGNISLKCSVNGGKPSFTLNYDIRNQNELMNQALNTIKNCSCLTSNKNK